CVRLHRVETFNPVMVSVRDVPLDIVAAIGDGFPAGEVAARFDINAHVFRGDNSWVDGYTDRQRVVHGGSDVAVLRGIFQEVFRDAGDEVGLRTVRRFELLKIVAGKQGALPDVGADHGK